MAYTIEQGPSGVFRLRAFGPGNLAEGQASIDALRAAAAPVARPRVLVDIRELEYIPAPAEARILANLYSAFSRAHRARIAFLAPPGAEYGVARMVSIIAELGGATTGAFTDEGDALRWLEAEAGGAAQQSDAS